MALRCDDDLVPAPSGSGAIGPATHRLAPVGHELRIHGLSGLCIADATTMPTLVSGNTNAACIMIGGRCADMMLAAG